MTPKERQLHWPQLWGGNDFRKPSVAIMGSISGKEQKGVGPSAIVFLTSPFSEALPYWIGVAETALVWPFR